ncbi:MAG: rod shape-determining protein RodA [Pseudomonadales bacterium]|uniref:Peptidoglycan glycosyltransferase MrdB n=2 Tax=Oleiphilus messinensis TaxID=141451 RepID=A0A1Y0ICF6_9GAMM|nr:rod shape-determining protein RodA [Oleiphilus messinensis]ARU58151.1 rod shape-determining protein RodA [Oleiphilus messinensis]MCG8609184.1 rod shape-determining protein RodA [Pseudomonadales bacterium]
MPDASKHLGQPTSLMMRLHIDPVLLIMLFVLSCAGLFILYSGSGESIEDVRRQAIRFVLAYGVMFAFAQLDPSVYRRWAPWLFLIGIVALIGVLVMGTGAKGAQRWLKLPGLPRFQPSEFMKLALPMMVAWYLSKRYLPPRLKHLFFALVIIIVPVVLIVKQPDLGTSLLILASGVFVLFFAGMSWAYIGGFIAMAGAAAPIMWFVVMRDYQKQRVLTFLNPESDPLGTGWNIIQSKTAIGSGGVYGKGWLQGTQSQLDFLPESHTDFIIAVLAEEFGFVGVLALLGMYLLIIARGLYIASQAQDSFSRLLVGSLTLTFFVYVFVNIGMVSGLLPVVGVPLPLVSYGGTSIVTLMAAFGVLMSVHTHKKMLAK